MEEFFSSNTPDTPTPINSAGNPTQPYGNATGEFNLQKHLQRKVKSRKDEGPKEKPVPVKTEQESDNATDRYFGSFSIEAKRNVMDLLKNHPMYDKKDNVQMNRVQNNTRDVMKNDATKTVENGGHLVRQNLPQASQNKY